jgi:hypothetical protein
VATRRAVDRRVASAVFAVAAGIFGALAAIVSPPVVPAARHDPRAAAELVAFMRVGERATYVVRYRYTRERADGARLPATTYEARTPTAFVTRDDTSLHVDGASGAYDCELVDRQPQCYRKPARPELPGSEVVRVAIDAGPYDVLRTAGARIAAERARCYSLRARHVRRQLPGLGRETRMCFATDGVPLRVRVQRLVVDTHEAESVTRTADGAALRPVFAGFERVLPGVPR